MKRLLLVFLLCLAGTALAALPQIELAAGKHVITAEVARSDPDRMQGLMHRRMLPENRGMLFVFPNAAHHAFWMMNTYIPLSIAFIDDDGIIVNIEDMQPHTQNSHPAKKPVRFALEMNQGWFAKRGIKPGMKISGLERAPPAQ